MYYRLPFATSGTTTSIPDTQPGNGAVNWTTGYSNVYQLDPGSDPLALRVERAQMNYILNTITATLKNLFENGIPPFIEMSDNNGVAYSYSKDALVKRSGVVYSSNANSNTTAPPGANWTVVDMAVFNAKASTASPIFTGNPIATTPDTGNVSGSIATTQFVRNVMAIYGHGTANAFNIPNLNLLTDGGTFYYDAGAGNAPSPNVGVFMHLPFGNSSGAAQFAIDLATGVTYQRRRVFSTWLPWIRFYTSNDSTAVIASGSNAYGYYRIYSDNTVDTFSRVVYNDAGTTEFFNLPTSINYTNAVVSVNPNFTVPYPSKPHAIAFLNNVSFGIAPGSASSVVSVHTTSTLA